MELMEKNPFNLYDGKLSIKDAVFLALEGLDWIENEKFSVKRLERVKDVSLFSCYTGYAPVDACNLTVSNIFQDSNERRRNGKRLIESP